MALDDYVFTLKAALYLLHPFLIDLTNFSRHERNYPNLRSNI